MDDITFRKDEDLESISVSLPLNLVGRSSTKVEAKIYYNHKKDNLEDIYLKLKEALETGIMALNTCEDKPVKRK